MGEIQFKTMTDHSDEPRVLSMMAELYREDPASRPPDISRFPLTIEHFLENPERGRIVLFLEGANTQGYSIVIPFWSNELGGTVLSIDELFVDPAARCRGIGRYFLESLAVNRPFNAIAAALEVSPANERARRLYQSIGFRPRRNEFYTFTFRDAR